MRHTSAARKCGTQVREPDVKVIIAGASGFLGRSLQRELIGHGHVVCTLVRRAPLAATEIEWHPDRNELSPTELAGADAVVCLSGAGIADKRWSPDYKRLLLDSRIQTNGTIAKTLAAMGESGRPATFVSASAIGYYGERGDVPLTEAASAGSGFLADLVTKWEASTRPASDAGVRVINLRTGLILAASAGLLKRLIPIFKAGIGGRLSSGQQYQSWISLADEIAAIRHVLRTAAVSGPVNLTGPEPVRN